ncbi:MAG: flagellar motor switch protein FliN [Armatimonadia bacterium]|nr:flagellar motor switch protein FliN [Armatimonadia bacterium]
MAAGDPGQALNAFEDLMGRAFNVVSQTLASTMPGADVSLVATNVSTVTVPDLLEEVSGQVVRGVSFLEGAVSESPVVCCVPLDDARAAVDLMSGGTGEEPPEEFEDYHVSAAGELVKYVVQAVAEHLTAELGQKVDASIDDVSVISLADETDDLADLAGEDGAVLLTSSFICGAPVISFYMVMPMALAVTLDGMAGEAGEEDFTDESAEEGDESTEEAAEAEEPSQADEDEALPEVPSVPADEAEEEEQEAEPPSGGGGLLNEEEIAAVLGGMPDDEEEDSSAAPTPPPTPAAQSSESAAPEQPAAPAAPSAPAGVGAPASQARPVEFENLGAEHRAGPPDENFELIANIPVQLSVELGRTQRTLGEILEFGTGSTIQLDKPADEPVDILAGGRHIAKGEVVVIDDNFAVRIRQILKPIKGIPGGGGGG